MLPAETWDKSCVSQGVNNWLGQNGVKNGYSYTNGYNSFISQKGSDINTAVNKKSDIDIGVNKDQEEQKNPQTTNMNQILEMNNDHKSSDVVESIWVDIEKSNNSK